MIGSVDEGSCCGRHSWSRRNAIVIVCRNVHHHDGRSCPRVCAQECEREPLLSAVVWSDWHCRMDKRAATKYMCGRALPPCTVYALVQACSTL